MKVRAVASPDHHEEVITEPAIASALADHPESNGAVPTAASGQEDADDVAVMSNN